ncbi:MAG: protein kinase [Lentisphaeria bacterium]
MEPENNNEKERQKTTVSIPESGKRKYLSGVLKIEKSDEEVQDAKEEKSPLDNGRRYLQKNKSVILETQLIDTTKFTGKKNVLQVEADQGLIQVHAAPSKNNIQPAEKEEVSSSNEELGEFAFARSIKAAQAASNFSTAEIYPELTEQSIPDIREAAKRGDYTLLDPIAKGAESILYKAKSGKYVFCVKAIRNRWDAWLGNSKTRNNQEKLQDVSYATKIRHLRNEYDVAKALYSDLEEMPIVRIIYLRKITRFGVELGYDLLMEYIQGHDLSDRNILKKLNVDDKIRLIYQATLALHYMHKRKLIHLDIKPSNFMITTQGKVCLIDFGISVICGFRGRSITGTAGYLSPEQVAKETLNETTDLFALGITFSIFFGGKALLQNQSELLQRSVRRDARFHLESGNVSAIADMPELSERPLIAEIIRNCSILKRENRIQNCPMLLQQLQNAAKSYGLTLE